MQFRSRLHDFLFNVKSCCKVKSQYFPLECSNGVEGAQNGNTQVSTALKYLKVRIYFPLKACAD